MGLYKGWLATMVGITPYIAFKMSTFDILRGTVIPQDRNHPYFHLYNLSLGAVAGTVAVTLTYPTDLIRRKFQL